MATNDNNGVQTRMGMIDSSLAVMNKSLEKSKVFMNT